MWWWCRSRNVGAGTAAVRELERRALWWLGSPSWEQWQFGGSSPDWGAVDARMSEFLYSAVRSGETIVCPGCCGRGHRQGGPGWGDRGGVGAAVAASAVPHVQEGRRGEPRTVQPRGGWRSAKLQGDGVLQFAVERGRHPAVVRPMGPRVGSVSLRQVGRRASAGCDLW